MSPQRMRIGVQIADVANGFTLPIDALTDGLTSFIDEVVPLLRERECSAAVVGPAMGR